MQRTRRGTVPIEDGEIPLGELSNGNCSHWTFQKEQPFGTAGDATPSQFLTKTRPRGPTERVAVACVHRHYPPKGTFNGNGSHRTLRPLCLSLFEQRVDQRTHLHQALPVAVGQMSRLLNHRANGLLSPIENAEHPLG